jgi:hypothetical protein
MMHIVLTQKRLISWGTSLVSPLQVNIFDEAQDRLTLNYFEEYHFLKIFYLGTTNLL